MVKFKGLRIFFCVNWRGAHMVDKHWRPIAYLPIESIDDIDFEGQVVSFTATDGESGETYTFEFQTHNVRSAE